MLSKITDKFQITIPKEIRTTMRLSRKDFLEWKIENGRVLVKPAKKAFLQYEGSIHVGKGSIQKDIELARRQMALDKVR